MKKNIIIGFVLVLVYFLPGIFSSSVYFIGDLSTIFYPYKVFARESLIKGVFPLWNPYIHNGTSFFGNLQSQVLYPFSIIFYIFNFSFASKIFFFLHLFLLFSGFFLITKNKFTSLVFTFSGFILSRMQFLSVFSTLSLMPFVFVLNKSKIFPLFILIFILTGYPHLILFSLILLFFYKQKKEIFLKILFGGILSSILIFPFLHTYFNSAMFKTPEIFVKFYFKIKNLYNLFIPRFPYIEETSWLYETYISIFPFLLFIKGFKNSKIIEKILFLAGISFVIFGLPFIPLRYSPHLFFIPLFIISIISGREWLKLRKEFRILTFILTFLLLNFEGKRLFPLIEKEYFFKKPEIINYIDKKHLGLLSPATRYLGRIKMFPKRDLKRRFFELKKYLFPNLNMVYHIKSFDGDDVLRPYIEQKIITELKERPFNESVAILKKEGIKFLITHFKINHKELIDSGKKTLPYIYYFKWNGIKNRDKKEFIKLHKKIFAAGLWISILTIVLLFKKIIIKCFY